MFDNPIFASFIPQILMVFAFVSCLVAPQSKNPNPENDLDKGNHQITYNKYNTLKSITSNTVDFSNLVYESSKSEITKVLFWVVSEVKINFSDKIIKGTPEVFNFLRPPPFLFFIDK